MLLQGCIDIKRNSLTIHWILSGCQGEVEVVSNDETIHDHKAVTVVLLIAQ